MLICEAKHGLYPVTNRLLKLQLIAKALALLRSRLSSSSVLIPLKCLLTLALHICTQMRPMYCSNTKINFYNYKIDFYYSQQTPQSNFSMQDQTQVFARGIEDNCEFSCFWRCGQTRVSSTNGGMLSCTPYLHSCPDSLVSFFTLPWYFSSSDCSASLYHLLSLTWHIR